MFLIFQWFCILLLLLLFLYVSSLQKEICNAFGARIFFSSGLKTVPKGNLFYFSPIFFSRYIYFRHRCFEAAACSRKTLMIRWMKTLFCPILYWIWKIKINLSKWRWMRFSKMRNEQNETDIYIASFIMNGKDVDTWKAVNCDSKKHIAYNGVFILWPILICSMMATMDAMENEWRQQRTWI